jgi:hypothetical protein
LPVSVVFFCPANSTVIFVPGLLQPPDRHRHLALENGVVVKRRAQLDAQRGPGRRICGRLFILCTEDEWHQKDGRREREYCRHPRFHVLDAKTVDDAR